MHWIKPVVAVRVSLQQIFRLYGIKLNRALARFDVRKLDAADAIDQVRALAGFQRVDLSLMYGRRKTVPRHAVDVHAVGGKPRGLRVRWRGYTSLPSPVTTR